MSTPRSLILMALKLCGAVGLGQSAQAEDVSDAYNLMRMMADTWARKRWLVFHLKDVTVPLTGSASYTVGVGGQVNIVRPDRIESAYLRIRPSATAPQDWPIQVLDAREDWNAITQKTIGGLPTTVFYDPAFPLAVLNVYPVPRAGSGHELHIAVKDGMGPGLPALDEPMPFPPEYDGAFVHNLAVRLRPYYQLPPDGTLTALALDSLNTLRKANAAIPRLRMPPGLPGMGAAPCWPVGPAPGTPSGFQVGISTLAGKTSPDGPFPNQDPIIA